MIFSFQSNRNYRDLLSFPTRRSSDLPYVLKEAAILFESGSYKQCDRTVLVTAPEELRIQRVMERDQVSEDRKSTRLNSSHVSISYAVFCLKRKAGGQCRYSF